jgi:hypothetical protein
MLLEVAEIVRTTDNCRNCLLIQRHWALWFFEIAFVLMRCPDHLVNRQSKAILTQPQKRAVGFIDWLDG